MPIELFPMSKTRMEVTHILNPSLPESPSPALPKGRESIPAEFKDVEVLLLPLGEGWDGACRWMVRTQGIMNVAYGKWCVANGNM